VTKHNRVKWSFRDK